MNQSVMESTNDEVVCMPSYTVISINDERNLGRRTLKVCSIGRVNHRHRGLRARCFISTVKYPLTLWSPVITVIRRSKSSRAEKKQELDIIILYIKTFIPESPNSADRSIQRLYTERYKQNAIDTITGH
jgi:hypothetical protein